MKQPSIFVVAAFLLTLAPFVESRSQDASLGADFVSRYVWRGTDFGQSFSVQPALTIGGSGFEIGAWGSYSVAADGAGSNELDLWAGYTFETESSGSFSVAVTDYYFPYPGAAEDGMDFFNYKDDGEGAHWIEPAVSYTGPDAFPISLFAGMMVHNDPDHSLYAEVGYPIEFDGDITLDLSAGASVYDSAFYGNDGFAFLSLAVAGTKNLKITDSFRIPVSVTYILNPEAKTDFLVFGVSL